MFHLLFLSMLAFYPLNNTKESSQEYRDDNNNNITPSTKCYKEYQDNNSQIL